MITDLSSILVQLVGAMITVAAVLGLVMPDVLIRLVSKVVEHPLGFPFAVAMRILLGAALITAASASRYPAILLVFGWIAIVAAIGLLFVGQAGMRRILTWVEGWSVTTIRIGLAFGAVFGILLVYGVS